MSLATKVSAVERLFRSLDKRIQEFQNKTKLQCATGCGKCCLKPDIEASVLEFLPFAYHFYHDNEFEEVMAFVEAPDSKICKLFKSLKSESDQGFCGSYPNRGLICRLFGYSALRDKYGNPAMFTCSIIKALPEYAEATKVVKQGFSIPYAADYYKRLGQIDYSLAREMLPINLAIRRAIQEVIHYYTYRPRRKSSKLRRAG